MKPPSGQTPNTLWWNELPAEVTRHKFPSQEQVPLAWVTLHLFLSFQLRKTVSLDSFKPLVLQDEASEYNNWKDPERWSKASPFTIWVLSLPNLRLSSPASKFTSQLRTRYETLPSGCVISDPRLNLSVPKSVHGMIFVFAAQTAYASLNPSSDVWCPSLQNVLGTSLLSWENYIEEFPKHFAYKNSHLIF